MWQAGWNSAGIDFALYSHEYIIDVKEEKSDKECAMWKDVKRRKPYLQKNHGNVKFKKERKGNGIYFSWNNSFAN